MTEKSSAQGKAEICGKNVTREIRELVSEGISVGNPWVTGQVTRVGGRLPW